MPVLVAELLRALCTLLPVDAPPRPLLPPGVLAVLRLLGPDGMTERETAEVLNYSYRHVRRLAATACELLGARNTRQAIYLATKSGLL
jgi:DNA-binding NarL/FixJ family response regulator